nr:vanadium-dependent haloperoxidase [Geodermatophilaceae bacterium]
GASSEVAAATAAYRVLRHYFPASAANLAADYSAFLAGIPNGVAKAGGKVVGSAAAATIIELRQHDGRHATVTLDVEPAPGVWRPTPPAFAPMLAPELGFVTPLLLDSATQFPPPGPDAIESAAYAVDYEEVRLYGAREGSLRTPEQTDTARFFADNAVLQYQAGMRDKVTTLGLDIVDSARAFAILNASVADALIAAWRAKYDYAYWRPITAIQLGDTDGNPATEPDPDWLPLVDTPPYPEYVSGHAPATGAASGTFSTLFGADSIDLNLSSAVTMTNRTYATAEALDMDTMNARIWLGLHFRKAMTDGNQLGHDVSGWATSNYFQPTD